MENSFISYLEQLKLVVFFAGYPIVYAIVYAVTGKAKEQKNALKKQLYFLLPVSYAFVGTIFLGYQLKSLSENLTSGMLIQSNLHPYLVTWGLLSLLFWLPALQRKPIYSLCHSFIFLFLLAKDFFPAGVSQDQDNHSRQNNMSIYGISILLNSIAFLLVLSITWFKNRFKRKSPQ